MRFVPLGQGMHTSVLGFGCAAIMGRAGRRASLAALSAAYEAGITFYDTARSYGYGESEAVLGEFLRGRRDSVLISTKFGIQAAPQTLLRRLAVPLARTLLRAVPAARPLLQRQAAQQLSAGHFSVQAMRSSLDASLRKLQTGYVDFFFLHLPPVSVLQQEDLFAALEQLSVAGKVLRYGIAADPPLALAALAARVPGLNAIQAPCNLFDLSLLQQAPSFDKDVVAIANHPFGGPQRINASKALLATLAADPTLPPSLREKLDPADSATLADLVLNLITGSGIQVVVPSMLQLQHVHTNVAALERSRFTAEELGRMRDSLGVLSKAHRGREL